MTLESMLDWEDVPGSDRRAFHYVDPPVSKGFVNGDVKWSLRSRSFSKGVGGIGANNDGVSNGGEAPK